MKLNYVDEIIEDIEVNKAENSITHVISTEKINRYGQIVSQEGLNRKNYQKNPIVLFDHGGGGMFDSPTPEDTLKYVIGKSLWQKVDGKKTIAKTQFNKKSDFAMEVFDFTTSGFLPAWSIGFMPDEESVEKKKDAIYINKSELYEYSKVLIGAAPDAVNEMKSYAKNEILLNSLALYEKETFVKNEFQELVNDNKELRGLIEELKQRLDNTPDVQNLYDIVEQDRKIACAMGTDLNKDVEILKTSDKGIAELKKAYDNQIKLLKLQMAEITGKEYISYSQMKEWCTKYLSGVVSQSLGIKIKKY